MSQVVTRGLVETLAKIKQVQAGIDEACRRIAVADAALIEGAAKRNFIGSHARSEPHVGGARPNVVSGTLRRSIRSDPPVKTGAGWSVKVGPSTVYGRRIELGYPGGSGRGRQRTRPFPYMRDAPDKVAAQMTAVAVAEMARVLG